jgi:hypothetical protein
MIYAAKEVIKEDTALSTALPSGDRKAIAAYTAKTAKPDDAKAESASSQITAVPPGESNRVMADCVYVFTLSSFTARWEGWVNLASGFCYVFRDKATKPGNRETRYYNDPICKGKLKGWWSAMIWTANQVVKEDKAFLNTLPPEVRKRMPALSVPTWSQEEMPTEKAAEADRNDALQGSAGAFESAEEGQPTMRYVTKYERDPMLRAAAIRLHGTVCVVCEFDFGGFYGPIGEGFIHVHHRRPVSEMGGPRAVDPAADLVPVCANCHAVIHRNRKRTPTVEELRAMVKKQKAQRA